MSIIKYNEYILEREFQSILLDILRIVENQTSDNTFEWDVNTKSKKTFGDYLSDIKTGLVKFKQFINKGEDPVDINFPAIDKLREFLKNLSKDDIIKYFKRIVSELKSLPYDIKKKILLKITIIFLSFVTINDIIPENTISPDTILSEIRLEISKRESNIERENINNKRASFDIAQGMVKLGEGGYTDDSDDDGNWTSGQEGSGALIGTNHGISAPVLMEYMGKVPSKSDMMGLTYDTALEIYKNDYWLAQKLNKLKDQSIANILYDACVNQGTNATLDIFKKSLEDIGMDTTSVKSWKELHRELNHNINNLDKGISHNLFNKIKKNRLETYKNAKRWYKYGDGWQNRLAKFEYGNNNTDLT